MPIVIQNKFDGGHAQDLRTFATDECEKSLNFDVLTNPHKLIPFPDSVAELVASGSAGDMDDIELADVEISLIAGSYLLNASGFESGGSAKSAFYNKTEVSPTLFLQDAVGPAGVHQKGSGVVYKDKFFSISISGTTLSLNRYNGSASVTTVGTVTVVGNLKVRPFIHPQDNVLYIVMGSVIAAWDGTTFSSSATILPAGYEAVSMTDYGIYLAIGVRPLRGNGKSVVHLWGRDLTLNTLQSTIDFGDGNLVMIENLNNDIIAVMQPWTNPSQSTYTGSTTKIIVKGYFGGAVVQIKELPVTSVISINGILKFKNRNRLYFGVETDAAFVVAKNAEGQYIISKDRYFVNSSVMNPVQALAMIGEVFWSGGVVSSAYVFMRSKTSSITYASSSIYKTTINPSMPIADRGKNKQLRAVRVYYTGKASGTITAKYAVDTSTLTSILSETTTAIEEMKQTMMQADGNAFTAGKEIQLQFETTGGVEIKAYEYEYKILNQ